MGNANRGYVAPQNMQDSQKEFGGSKSNYKKLPSAEGEKQFHHPSEKDKGVLDRKHDGVKAPRFNE